ncbi:MAG: glycosyl hydrolase family 28-related protein, partial [Devosia sp.]
MIHQMATGTVLSNLTGGTTNPSDNTVSSVLDFIGSTQGDILYRNASGWAVLGPGTSGQFLKTQGAAANPTWATPLGAVAVTSRTALKALDTGTVTTAILTEAGREGTFVFRSGDYSSQIAADTQEGIYIKADAVAPTSGAWVRAYNGEVDAEWFGATGDGTTDDATAMQAAIDYVLGLTNGGRLYFPEGTYLFGTRLTIPNTANKNFELVGDGDEATILKPKSTLTPSDGVIYVGSGTSTPTFLARFRDFRLQGTNNQKGIYLDHANGVQISQVYFVSLYRGILGHESYALRTAYNTYDSCTFYGVQFDTAAHAFESISCGYFNVANGTNAIGVNFDGASISYNVKLIGNDFEGNDYAFSFNPGVGSLLLEGNYIENCAVALWYFGASSSGVVMEDNWIASSPSTTFNNLTSGRFSNNTVYNQTLTLGSAGASFLDGRGNAAIGTGSIPALPSLIGGALGPSDNRLLRSDGTGGKTAQGSAITVDDTGAVSGVSSLATTAQFPLTLSWSDDSNAVGPIVQFVRVSASPAANDPLADFRWIGRNSSNTSTQYGIIRGVILDPTAASEDGEMQITTLVAGSFVTPLKLSDGVQAGSPTGGYKGSGTINATGVYDDGTLLTCAALSEEFINKGTIDVDYWDSLVPDQIVPESRELVPQTYSLERQTRVARDVPDESGRLIRRVETVTEVEEVPAFIADPVFDEDGNIVDGAPTYLYDEVVTPAQTIKRQHRTARIFKAMLDAGFDPRDPEQYFARMTADQALPGMPTRGDGPLKWEHNSLSLGEIASQKWLAMEMLAIVCNAMWLKLKDHEARINALEGKPS